MIDTASKYKVPSKTIVDHAHTAVRTGLGCLPHVGSAAVELFQAVIAPPLERRRNEWMDQVADGLKNLEERKILTLDQLSGNEVFINVMLHATQVALKNFQKEKLDALRNAVLNSARPISIHDARQQMFVNFIDEMTVYHLRFLTFFAAPKYWFEVNNKTLPDIMMGGRSTFLTAAFPELGNDREFYDQVGKELYRRGLINTENFHATQTVSGLCESCVTGLGQQFLNFIQSP